MTSRLSEFLDFNDEYGRAEWLDQYIDWDRIVAEDGEGMNLNYLTTIVNPSFDTWVDVIYAIALLSDMHQPMSTTEREAWRAVQVHDLPALRRVADVMHEELEVIRAQRERDDLDTLSEGEVVLYNPAHYFPDEHDFWYWLIQYPKKPEDDRRIHERALAVFLARIPDGEALERARRQIRQMVLDSRHEVQQ